MPRGDAVCRALGPISTLPRTVLCARGSARRSMADLTWITAAVDGIFAIQFLLLKILMKRRHRGSVNLKIASPTSVRDAP
jgi:hypothetical protein